MIVFGGKVSNNKGWRIFSKGSNLDKEFQKVDEEIGDKGRLTSDHVERIEKVKKGQAIRGYTDQEMGRDGLFWRKLPEYVNNDYMPVFTMEDEGDPSYIYWPYIPGPIEGIPEWRKGLINEHQKTIRGHIALDERSKFNRKEGF